MINRKNLKNSKDSPVYRIYYYFMNASWRKKSLLLWWRMDLTPRLIALINSRIEELGISQIEIARTLNRSEGWVSKALSGKIRRLGDAHVLALEQMLEVPLSTVIIGAKAISPLAIEVNDMIEREPENALVLSALVRSRKERRARLEGDARYLGAALIAIVDGNRDHPEKVARLAIKLIVG